MSASLSAHSLPRLRMSLGWKASHPSAVFLGKVLAAASTSSPVMAPSPNGSSHSSGRTPSGPS
eukprot:3829750-Pyramimonas_sp.AAC.1